MAGASREHNLIAANLVRRIGNQLDGRPCETYTNDMRVLVSQTGLYTYPDVIVVCGEALFLDENEDTLLNPTVIAEVLSPTTEAYDRGKKFGHYRRLESLREYVLVAQDEVLVEHYVREGDDLASDRSAKHGRHAIARFDRLSHPLAGNLRQNRVPRNSAPRVRLAGASENMTTR